MNIYVVGSLNMDLVINSKVMPKSGETLTGYNFFTNSGGKGANQAVAISLQGGSAKMVGSVGKEFGEELLNTLSGYGVDIEHVKKCDDVSSGIAVIIVVDGDNRIILDPAANYKITKSDIDDALKNATKEDYVLCQLEIPNDIVMYTFKVAKEKGLTTFLNTAPAKEIPNEIFKYTDYVIANQTETEIYTNIYPKDIESAKKASESFKKMGVNKVLITLGEKGSVLFDGEDVIETGIFKTEVIDTTAAGDTYIGSFLTRLAKKESYKEAMRYAAASATLTISKHGAQQSIPKESDVLEFLRRK